MPHSLWNSADLLLTPLSFVCSGSPVVIRSLSVQWMWCRVLWHMALSETLVISMSVAVHFSFLVLKQVFFQPLLVSSSLFLAPKCISLSLLHFSFSHRVASIPYLKKWILERIGLVFFQRFTLPVHVINACIHLHAPNRDILEMQSRYVFVRYCIAFQHSQSIFHLQGWEV